MDFSKVLSDGDVERIHEAAEDILETAGFKVMDPEALRAFAGTGAKVDEHSGLVRLPRPLLRELLQRAPSDYTVAGIDGSSYGIGGERPWGLAIVTDPWIIDYETGAPRRPCLEDLRRHTIIAQKMDVVAGISCMDFPVTDVEGPASSLRAWEMHLLHSGKHYHFIPAHPESHRRWEAIVRILARDGAVTPRDADPVGKRLFSVHVAVISPLSISRENVDLLRLACAYDAPVFPTICPMAGSTAPYSIASTLLQGHAENLFLAALTQLLRPGNPFIYTFGPSLTDMRTGHDLYYTLDKVLWKIGAVQLAKCCGLPVSAEAGGTMTHRYDPQNGMEGALFMLAAVASGASLLAGFGSGYAAVGMSAELMLIQEAWMAAARFLCRGINTDEAHLGLENIMQAGPGGEFLTDPMTLSNMRGHEFFQHSLFDRSPADVPSKGMLERAHERVEELVADFQSPVPEAVQEELRRYFHDTCSKLQK